MQLPPFLNSVFSSVHWFGDELGIINEEKNYILEHEKIPLPLPVSLHSPPQKNLKTKNYVVLFRITQNLQVKIPKMCFKTQDLYISWKKNK